MTTTLSFHAPGPHWGLMGRGFMDVVRGLPAPPVPFFAAALVFAAVAFAGQAAGWLHGPAASARTALDAQARVQPKSAAEREAARAHARNRCDNCGVVKSIRRMEPVAGQPASYEFIVRLRDGSTRTSNAPSTSKWREGDRVMLIGGEKSTDH